MSLAGDFRNDSLQNQNPDVLPVDPNLTQVHGAPEQPKPQTKMPQMPKIKLPSISIGKMISESIYFKYIKLFTIFILSVGLLIAFVYVLKFDTLVLKLDLSGTISGLENKPISGAEIYIDGEKKATTNENGVYKVSGLELKSVEVKIVAENYFEKTETIKLNRSFLNYANSANFQLTSSLIGNFKGKFIANSGIYDFAQDRLIVNDKSHKINTDGTFDVKDVNAGEVNLKFISKSFQDIDQEIEIKAGENILSDITLTPAGDIEDKLVGFIKEEIPNNIEIQATNIPPEIIEIDNDGNLTITNLEVGKKYDFRIFASGYLTRDYSVTIVQGVNRIFGLKMVEDGNAVYSKLFDNNKSHLFISEYDGTNEIQLTNDEKLLPQNFYYDSNENKVYFQSDIERITGIDSRRILPVYSIDLTTKEIKKITTTNLDTIVPNYEAKKLVNITKNSKKDPNRRIEIADLSGGNIKLIRESENATINQAILSADGTTVYLVESEIINPDNLKLYAVKNGISTLVSERQNLMIYDVSNDGNKVIFSGKSTTQPFDDLFVYDLNSLETRTLITNQKGRDYQFVNGSNDIFIYRDFVAGRDNIFRFTISSNSNDQITRFGVEDELLSIYQQDKFIYYITEKALYVLDFAKPNLYKIVKEGLFFAP